jgi:hypothetical protein
MIAIAALALGLSIGGPDYASAYARAKAYERIPAARVFMQGLVNPKLQAEIARVANDCQRRYRPKANVEFILVISYAATAYPENPPFPDLAEEVHFILQYRAPPPAPQQRR